MQIRMLRIYDHRCLNDFQINFAIDTNGGSSTILIGENGTGKSTMIQTVLEIFASFDSVSIASRIQYRYELEYYYKGSIININQWRHRYVIKIDDEEFCRGVLDTVKKHLERTGKRIFPERISYFYAGENNLALLPIQRVEHNYTQKCKGLISAYWNALYLQNRTYAGDFPKKKYIYCTEKLVPVYLLSILCGQDSNEKRMLVEQCHFSSIEAVSILLSFDKISGRLQNDILETGNEGVCNLISFIDDRFTDLFHTGYLYRGQDYFIYELHDIGTVDADSIAFFNFFEKLGVLFDAEIGVTVKIGNASVQSQYLSEGQRQLIKVLGMLGVCKGEDCLVLLDEPDVHMNPKWKYNLKAVIDECLFDGEVTNTQAIIATHDPLVVNGVPKESIRIFTQIKVGEENAVSYKTRVIEPTENTFGMGIDGLLQSQYYRLQTTYDKPTSDKFRERQLLYIKLINNEISPEEKERLMRLTRELGSLPKSFTTIDFLYDDFIKVYRNSPLYSKEYLTFDELDRRRAEIDEIINALYEAQI